MSFFFVGRVLRRVPRWHDLGDALRVASVVTLVLLAVAQVTFDAMASGANVGVAGLTERMLILEVLVWFVLMGWSVVRSPRATSELTLRSAA